MYILFKKRTYVFFTKYLCMILLYSETYGKLCHLRIFNSIPLVTTERRNSSVNSYKVVP